MQKKITKAVIPAAGLGTRLLPLSKAAPKELLPVFDRPSIQHSIDESIEAGITDILIIISKGKESIKDYFTRDMILEDNLEKKGQIDLLQRVRKTSSPACNIHFCYQGDVNGLGGAILSTESFIGDDDAFAVLLPDDLILNQNGPSGLSQMIAAYHEQNGHICAAMTVPDDRVHQYGVFKPHDGVSDGMFLSDDLVEKPDLADAPSNLAVVGRYVLEKDIFAALRALPVPPPQELQITDAIRSFCKDQRVFGYVFKGTRFDTGHIDGLLEANIAYGQKTP
jgi:UTP--glucose-1-phosphate uridylyltransferase